MGDVMNPLKIFALMLNPREGWRNLQANPPSMHRLYLLHVLPLALIPAVVLYAVALRQTPAAMEHHQILLMALAVFLLQLVLIPAMASIIRQLAEVAEIFPRYQQAFLLTAVAPTPIWLATLIYLQPALSLNVLITIIAIGASALLVFHGIPVVFEVRDQKHALLLFGAIMMAGIIAWSFLMVCTLIGWGGLQSINVAG